MGRRNKAAICRVGVGPEATAVIALRLAALGLATAFAPHALAQMPEYGSEIEQGFALWAGVGWSDNIRREANAEHGNYQALGTIIGWSRERERLSAGFVTDIQYRQYSLDDLDNEVIGSLDAFAEFGLIPERFTWNFFDSYGQGRTDPFAAAGPLNRQNINVFSTGPTIALPLGRRTELEVSGLFRDYRHEETEQFNSQTTSFDLGLFRQTSPVTRLGLVGDSQDIDYSEIGTKYTIRGAALHYERLLATGEFVVEVGRNELVLENETSSGPRASVSWRRAIGNRSSFEVLAGKEYTDAGAFFAFTATESNVADRSDLVLTPSPLEQQRLELSYEFSTPKTGITIGVAVSDEKFTTDSTLDNRSTTLLFEFSRLMSTRTNVTFTAQDVERDFYDSAGDAGDRFFALALDYRLSRQFSLVAGVGAYDRRGAEYFDETRYELRLRYEPLR